jgi:type I restriction enzyme, S subunit
MSEGLGWALATVGEIATLTDGPFGSNLKTSHYVESGPRVVRLQNIGDGVFRDEYAHITDEHFVSLHKHEVVGGDIVAASLGDDPPRACLVPSWLGPAIVKADCIRIRVAGGIESAFLMWMLNSRPVRQQAAVSVKGIGRPRLGLGGIRKLLVPVPPLNEQRRIVAAIEEHLSRLDAADASLAAGMLRLDALRTATLRDAVNGGWPVVPLGELALRLRNGVFVSRPAAEPPGTPIFRISAVRPLALDHEDVRYARNEVEHADEFFVEEGDLLFTRYSGNPDFVGACARVRTLAHPTLHPDKLIRVVLDRERVDPAFVELACSSGSTLNEIRTRRKTTAGQVGIAGGQLKTVPVPLPPLEEQERIVAEVEARLSALDALRASIERAQQRSRALRAAVLAKAFRGELVPQDPADEPADRLLARLRAEREGEPTPRRTRRKKVASED